MAVQDDLWAWLQSMRPTRGPTPFESSQQQAAPGGPGSAGDDSGFNNPYAAAAQALPAQGGPYVGGQGVTPEPLIVRSPHLENDINQPLWFPSSNTPMPWSAPAGAPPQGTPSETPKPADSAKGPLASPGQGGIGSDAKFPLKRRAGAPNLGYYQGNPRFSTFQYETPNSSKSRAPVYTAMNLGGPTPFGPFGGGGQPAASPNVPAAAAQPVSAPVYNRPSTTFLGYQNAAPWDYGPLQRNRIWGFTGDPALRS